MRIKNGFSLIELLVCITIIAIIMAMYMPALNKARQKAQALAGTEAVRQRGIGRMADGGGATTVAYSREECRAAYRQTLDAGRLESMATELLYVVRNENEFKAYWYTLIDPAADGELEFSGSTLVATDNEGNTYHLDPVPYNMHDATDRYGTFPVMWDYLSSNMADMSNGTLSIGVLYSDGHMGAIHYPGEYPICKTVATLSNKFLHN